RRVRQGATVRGEDADGRGDGPRVGLRLGDARPRLDVGVERHGDRGENADDRHDDQKLDQCEATLATTREDLHHVRFPPERTVSLCLALVFAWGVPDPGALPRSTSSSVIDLASARIDAVAAHGTPLRHATRPNDARPRYDPRPMRCALIGVTGQPGFDLSRTFE